MKRKKQWIMAVVLCAVGQGAWAQDGVNAEPSQTLTEIRKGSECTVYAFNYPSVSATGKPTVLSSALFVWTPAISIKDKKKEHPNMRDAPNSCN